MEQLRGSSASSLAMVFGLVATQVVYATNTVFLNIFISRGYHPLFLVALANFVISAILLPIALLFERKKWPSTLGFSLMAKFVIMSLVGVTIHQELTLLGAEQTSPTIASAMPNLGPGFMFVIATCLGFEKVDMGCKYSKAKMVGTVLCICGAVAAVLFLNPINTTNSAAGSMPNYNSTEWMVGCGYLLAAVILASFNTLLQASVLKDFPAPISCSAIYTLVGCLLALLQQLIFEGKLSVASNYVANDFKDIIGIALIGATNGLSLTYQIWSISRRGPVYVSMFIPIQAIFSAIVSSIFLRQFVGIKSLTGLCFTIIGLYMFLWAKKKETSKFVVTVKDIRDQTKDLERSLLS